MAKYATSQRLELVIPAKLKEQMIAAAAKDGISTATYMRDLVKLDLAKREESARGK